MPTTGITTNGYEIVRGILALDAIEQLRETIDGELAKLGPEHFEFGGYFGLSERQLEGGMPLDRLRDHPSLPAMIKAFALHPSIMALVSAVLAPQGRRVSRVHLGENGAKLRDNEADATHWHTDGRMPLLPRNGRRIELGDPVTLTVVYAVDDFTSTNGATEIAVASHLDANRSPDAKRDTALATMNAGDALVMIGSHVFHRAGLNTSSAARRRMVQVRIDGLSKIDAGSIGKVS
ncbi:MAG: phytanoyl-CoA dioxygenase family protein [Kofleriaceae bacterium]